MPTLTSNFDVQILAEHYIFTFEIAVCYPSGVAVVDCRGHLTENVAGLHLRYAVTTVDVVKEIAIFGQLKDKEAVVFGLKDLVHSDDVWMSNVLDNVKLAGKKLAQVVF